MPVYYIQRGIFRAGITGKLNNSDITGIDSVVSQDYMGSAEFEFGALSKALKEMLPTLEEYQIEKTGYKNLEGQGLFLFCKKNQKDDILQLLLELTQEHDGKLISQLKERTYLHNSLTKPKEKYSIGFWWNISSPYSKTFLPSHPMETNCFDRNVSKANWMMGLGKNNMAQVQLGLQRLKERWTKESKL